MGPRRGGGVFLNFSGAKRRKKNCPKIIPQKSRSARPLAGGRSPRSHTGPGRGGARGGRAGGWARDFVHVRDAAQAVGLAVAQPSSAGPLDVGTGQGAGGRSSGVRCPSHRADCPGLAGLACGMAMGSAARPQGGL